MLDCGRIVGGIFVVLTLASGPAWIASIREAAYRAPREAPRSGPCVEPRAVMIRNHPQILADWREKAVRGGVRYQSSTDGHPFHPSLTGTCLGCHGTASGFCNQCHADVGVSLNCWSCHDESPNGSPLPFGGQRIAGIGH